MCISFDILGYCSTIICACVVQPLEVDDRPKILCEFVTQVYSAFMLFAHRGCLITYPLLQVATGFSALLQLRIPPLSLHLTCAACDHVASVV